MTGTASVFDHAPGEVFTYTFETPEQEALYLDYGHLEVLETGYATGGVIGTIDNNDEEDEVSGNETTKTAEESTEE